jgi:hypothetical protein
MSPEAGPDTMERRKSLAPAGNRTSILQSSALTWPLHRSRYPYSPKTAVFEFLYFPPLKLATPILQFHPQRTAFRLFFLSLQHHLSTQSSHCVNRIITSHFLEGQISCHARVLPFPIDNHVCLLSGSLHRVL